MKYIRTKEYVYELISDINNKGYNVKVKTPFSYALVSKAAIIAQADTIEELCDEFVYIDDYERPYLCNFDYNQDAIIHYKNGEIGCIFKTSKNYMNIKGAIWTDKGLIYVAQMNDKGELELL